MMTMMAEMLSMNMPTTMRITLQAIRKESWPPARASNWPPTWSGTRPTAMIQARRNALVATKRTTHERSAALTSSPRRSRTRSSR